MGRPPHNRNALHVKLYQTSGHRHVIRKTQKMLAAELGMSQFTLNRIMSEMVDDGRLKIIGKGSHAAKTYIVYDPVEWCDRHHDPTGAEFARRELDGPQASPSSQSPMGDVQPELPQPAESDGDAEEAGHAGDREDPGFAVSDIFFSPGRVG